MQRRLWCQLRMREKVGFEMAFKCLFKCATANSMMFRYIKQVTIINQMMLKMFEHYN